ncbi:MAG TPA: AMP-binding protein [Gemmatimonadaceae bacterium]|nr:AMP-binding protein [Gemmatimonadaceae bacterium]
MAARPWHAHYDPGVPHSLAPYTDLTLVDLVAHQAAEHPERAALRFEGRVISYRELYAEGRAFARALEDRGVKRGDRVALLLPNVPQFVIAELGAWMAGAIVAPMNPTYPDEELAGLIERAGATVAVVLAPFYDRMKAVQPRTGVRHVIVAHVRDALRFPKSLLFRLFKERKGGHGIAPRRDDDRMSALLAEYRGMLPSSEPPRAGESAALLPSGGTTGTPKWVEGTHGGLSISGRQLHAWLSPVLAADDTFLVPLPLFHTYALSGIQSLAFASGLSLSLVANPRDTGGMLRTIRRDHPRFICAVPTLLNAIMAHEDAAKSRSAFRAVKLCFSGAAPLLAETRKRFEALTGGVVMEGYSLTEAQMAVIANPPLGEKKTGSVGMPLPDVDLRIVELDDATREAAPGEAGEVLISAPQLMRGYWNQPDETGAVMSTDRDGRRWLHTGDIGYLDPDGYLFLTDRKKELIKVSGYQVWPREVEEAISAHPAVLEAGVAPITDPTKGEVPKAWVVLRAGQNAAPDELRAFCRERLAPYKVPAQVSIVPELPKTTVGKVLRRKLKELDAGKA